MAGEKVGFHEEDNCSSHMLHKKLLPNNGKLGRAQPHQSHKQPQLRCPECGSTKIWKDGLRYTSLGPVQRYICRNCAYRFSDPNFQHAFNSSDMSRHDQRILTKLLKSNPLTSNCQICATKTTEAKNLAKVENRLKNEPAGTTRQAADVKGKIISFAWWMQKQGYARETIRSNLSRLRALQARNGNLLDPESIKEVLAREKNWSQNTRRNTINAYTLFLKFNGMQWEKPRCNVTRKIPFIPTEQEIDDLIAGSSKKVSTLLQLLKETAMSSGEAKRLLWTDIDFERKIIILNQPEKNGLPRIWNVSSKLLKMLDALPRKSLRTFGDGPINSIKTTFMKARRRLAAKLQNPRLLQIHFHTLRHWKATTEYHRTKDPLHVMQFLGHKKLDSTLLYVQLEERLFKTDDDNFTCKVAHNVGEATAIIEVGFEYVTGEYTDGGKIFRKRK